MKGLAFNKIKPRKVYTNIRHAKQHIDLEKGWLRLTSVRINTGAKKGFKESRVPDYSWKDVAAAMDKKERHMYNDLACECKLRYNFVSRTWAPAFICCSIVHKPLEPQEREAAEKEYADVALVIQQVNSLSLKDAA